VHVASSRRSHGSEAKDDRFDIVECGVVEVRSNYPSLVVIFLFVHMDILVFWFLIKIELEGCCGRYPSSTPFALCFHFLLGVSVLHVSERRGEK
jgi:hypothetical protein